MFNGFFASAFNTKVPVPWVCLWEWSTLSQPWTCARSAAPAASLTSLSNLMGYIQEYSKSCLLSLQGLPQWFFNSFGNLEKSHLAGSWLMLPQFSWRVKRMSLEIWACQSHGKIMQKIILESIGKPEEQFSH